MPGRKHTKEAMAEAKQLYFEGVSLKEIHQRTGVQSSALYGHLPRDRVKRFGKGGSAYVPRKDLVVAVGRFLAGHKIEDIIDETGIQHVHIYYALKRVEDTIDANRTRRDWAASPLRKREDHDRLEGSMRQSSGKPAPRGISSERSSGVLCSD